MASNDTTRSGTDNRSAGTDSRSATRASETQQQRAGARRTGGGGDRVNDQDYIDMNNEALTEEQRNAARARYDARSRDRRVADMTTASGTTVSTPQAKPIDSSDPVLPPPPRSWPGVDMDEDDEARRNREDGRVPRRATGQQAATHSNPAGAASGSQPPQGQQPGQPAPATGSAASDPNRR